MVRPRAGENYRDSKSAALVGRHALSVDAMHTDYARPQDNGLRTDVRWARFTDGGGNGLRADFDLPGDVQAHRYATADLDAAAHACDLARRDRVFVHLGYRHNGLGSHSCGPALSEGDRLKPEPFAFVVTLRQRGQESPEATLEVKGGWAATPEPFSAQASPRSPTQRSTGGLVSAAASSGTRRVDR